MTLNIPFLFARVLVQHLFGMEENLKSVVRHLRASLSTLPIRTKAKCHIQSERLSLTSRCKRAQYSCGTEGGFTPNGLTLVQTLFTRYRLIIY
ncbi:hypothetical protein SERLA73DRAFT_181169 [Serpula lacrymans var. lacrymans S7.3]|uniref:Uncharacterized protein n=1 Tax=Serpula lacrymans var. lacrymans (strain S7.3) TaxID=936435 RepID=F8PXK6_SERL3|nr:hypothetical protein SERLA73DRAFT_181169 [Serpula lacrymans var. lacrymans S7.3]